MQNGRSRPAWLKTIVLRPVILRRMSNHPTRNSLWTSHTTITSLFSCVFRRGSTKTGATANGRVS
ncbi:hypothetical protein JG687_00016418, partial [Phytophthora cactorum]